MRLPRRASIELRERFAARIHVRESAEPDEAISIIEIAELADEAHPRGLLRFDEFTFEELDQLVAAAGTQRVLSELDDHRTRSKSMTQFVSHVTPPSSEKACSHRALSGHSFVQRKRT